MRKDVDELLVHAQVLLEKGLQECLELTGKLIERLESKVQQGVGYRFLFNAELLQELTSTSGKLYKVMAETLFRLIPALQPEDCEYGQPINFYFWPGYHSVLIDQRIFVKYDEGNFGVGIYGRPDEELSTYHDSCQARWYHYLIKRRKECAIAPIDIHRILLKRAAEKKKDDDLRFIVVTTKPIPTGATPLSYFQLRSNHRASEGWGKEFATFVVRGDMGLRRLLGAQPKITNREFRRQAQNKIQSLWLHSAFCDFEPPWLPEFIRELSAEPQTRPLSESLQEALTDKDAIDWGDGNKRRPLFSNWVNLSLSPWLDPRTITMGDEQPTDNKPSLASKTVGSAAFLSSMPLRPLYLAFAKHWVSEVYNAIRNAEIAMLLHNKQLRTFEAFAAGPYFAHEIQTVVDQSLATVQRGFADDDEEAKKTRRFVLYSIRTLCTLAYSFTNVVMSPTKYTVKEEAEKLLDPLRKLRDNGSLIDDLTNIAKETYESLKRADGGRVIFPEPRSPGISAKEDQHGACFLLTVELLRNYCHSKQSGPTARFRSWLVDDVLMVELAGSTRAEKDPTSMSVARLNRFLRILGIGKVTMDWDWELKTFKATVQVDLGPDSAADHQFS